MGDDGGIEAFDERCVWRMLRETRTEGQCSMRGRLTIEMWRGEALLYAAMRTPMSDSSNQPRWKAVVAIVLGKSSLFLTTSAVPFLWSSSQDRNLHCARKSWRQFSLRRLPTHRPWRHPQRTRRPFIRTRCQRRHPLMTKFPSVSKEK